MATQRHDAIIPDGPNTIPWIHTRQIKLHILHQLS
jgi:hypothetical protein